MSRWFRVHDDLVDDPKVQLLSGEMVKSLLNIWCLASQNDGLLPSMKEMAFKLRMKPQQVAAIIAELSAASLIDQDGSEYRPHNWDKRQYKSDTDKTAAERAKRYRAKHRDGNGPVTRDGDRDGNVRSERPETEADTEQKQSKEIAPSAVDLAFDEFWRDYPKRDGSNPKEPAAKLFRAAVKAGAPSSEIIAGVRNCAVVEAKNVGTPYIPQAVKWLRDQRWKDYQTSSPVQAASSEIDWDAVLTSFKRFGVWSKHAGPDLDSPACRVPPEMLAKHGLLRTPTQPVEAPRLKSMGGLN